jgi:hypothetical protein
MVNVYGKGCSWELSRHLTGGTEERNDESPSVNSGSLGRYSKLRSPEYDVGVLPT